MSEILPPRHHASSLDTFQRCQRKYWLDHRVVRIEPPTKSVHLHAGSCIAQALEVARKTFYWDGLGAAETQILATNMLVDSWGDPMLFATSPKNLQACCVALDKYLTEFPLDQSEYVPLAGHVEHKLSAILGGMEYDGTPDMVCEYAGEIWCLDDKTTGGRLDDTWRASWLRRGQFMGYAWLLEQHGIEIAGTIVRGIQIGTRPQVKETYVPTPPHLVKEWQREAIQLMCDCEDKQDFLDCAPSLGVSCVVFGAPCEYLQRCLSTNPEQA